MLKARPDIEQVLGRVSPKTRAALDTPSLSRWHDGGVVFDLTLTNRDEVKVPSIRAWAGVLRSPFDLCEVKGTLTPRLEGFDGHHLVYELSWTR